MNRVILAALIGAAFFVLGYRPAPAMVEFCPVGLSYERVGSEATLVRQQSSHDQSSKSANETSALYGFELTGFGPRTITQATLTFDTSGGWYTVHVPAVTLDEKDRHYTGPSSTFVRRDYVSPIMYVHFPEPITVAHGWVSVAGAQGDSQFDWDKQGTIACDPMPEFVRVIALTRFNYRGNDRPKNSIYTLDPKDRDVLSAAPQSGSLVLPASPAPSQADTSCGTPFDFAIVTESGRHDFPESMRGYFGFTTVEVAIDQNGKLVDAWVWGPSGHSEFDDAAVEAARSSTYVGGRAYCKPAPGYYFFRVTFQPG